MRHPHAIDCKHNTTNMCTCDGYHTFEELYKHRINLYIALCRAVKRDEYVWKSKYHSDGSEIPNWFILGIGVNPGMQITYHLPMSEWDNADFYVFEKAVEFDGHTSNDVLDRLTFL